MLTKYFSIFLCAATIGMAAPAAAQTKSAASDIANFTQGRPVAPPSFTYAPDGNGYLMLSPDGRTVDRYDIATGKKIETIFDATHTRETTIPHIEGFKLSDKGNYLLVYNNSEAIYRHSFTANYYIYEVRTRLLHPLSTEHPRQQAPLISPDGRMVAFVADNNIYIRKNDYGSEVAVTKDGEFNKVINGVPDWVNEEEFSNNRSMVWSPDNLTLCFLRYDEEKVPMYSLPIYEGACNPKEEYAYYPGTYSYKYPVPGETNAVTTLHSYNVETRKVTDIPLPDAKIEYIPRIEYGGSSSDRLMVSTLNRDQNHFEIYSVNPKSTVAKSVYSEDTKAWIEPETYENIKYVDDGFVLMSSQTGYRHVYKYSYAGSLMRTITSGDFDVTAFYGFDAKGYAYYQAAYPTPMDRTVSRIDLKNRVERISKENGTTNASFAPGMAYAMLRYTDVNTPPVYTINQANGKQTRVLEDNAACAARYANAPRREFFTFNSDGNTINGYIVRSKSATGKQPVIMSQYSGPGSQSVLNIWSMDWENYYAMNGYTIVCVDGRGTGGRGYDFMTSVYKRLGHYETVDQVNAARWVASQPWADANAIGIYGWSYGGFESLMCATEQDGPFAASVAVAPVTSWRFYDSIYTERYMLTPQQNEEGYRVNSPIYRVPNLTCPTLVMYGTADDNVHPQNALQFVSTLQSIGGLCDMFVFPNMNHSINGCNSRSVVYARMLKFFDTNLKK